MDETTRFLLQLELGGFLVLLLASAIMGRIEKRTIADYGLPWRLAFRSQFWQGVAVGFGVCSSLMAILWLAGLYQFEALALHGFDIAKWAMTWALVFVLVGLREEFRSRGYELFTLTTGIGFWPAALATAIFFGYGHHGNTGEDWIGLVNAGAFGLLACLFLRRTGNLWMPIGIHAMFDWGETYFYGVADSGHVLPGHLLNGHPTGPAWLSGGTVGPEGSVIATAVLVLVWVIAARWLPEAKYPASSSDVPAQLVAPSHVIQ